MRGECPVVTVRSCMVNVMTGRPISSMVMRHRPLILRVVCAHLALAIRMTIALTVSLADLIPSYPAQRASDQCAVPATDGVSHERTCPCADCRACHGVG